MFVAHLRKSPWACLLFAAARRARAHCLFQIVLILAFWQAGEIIARLTHLPVPGAIIGLLAVLGLLLTGCVKHTSLQLGASWFLAQLLLFLMPTALALLDHPEFISRLGLKIFAAILLGTLTVMLVTALVVDFAYRLLLKRQTNAHA